MMLRKGLKYDAQARSGRSLAGLFDSKAQVFDRQWEQTFGPGAYGDHLQATPVFDAARGALDAYSTAVIAAVNAVGPSASASGASLASTTCSAPSATTASVAPCRSIFCGTASG